MSAQPTAGAMRAAAKLKEEFAVGTFSRFCDDAEFDNASDEEVAAIIDRETGLAELAAALKEYLSYSSIDGRQERQPLREKLRAVPAKYAPEKEQG